MEKSRGVFSPQFENYLGVSHCSEVMPADGQEHGKDCAVSKSLEPPPDNICTKGSPKSSSDKITKNKEVNENCSSGSDHVEDCYKQVNITDLLCAICKELLYRPVVLNCGHGMAQKFSHNILVLGCYESVNLQNNNFFHIF